MATGIPHWDDDPETWDILMLGTQRLNGVWDVEDGSGKRVFDIKKGPGRDGALIKDMGYEPGSMTLVGQLASAEDWEALQAIIEPLRITQKGKGEREPIGISHPKTILLGITQVVITEIGFPQIDNGIMTVRISALEYTKPKATGKKKSKQTADLSSELNEVFSGDFAGANAVTAGAISNKKDAAARQEAWKLEQQRKDVVMADMQAQGRPTFDFQKPQYSPSAP